MLEIVHELAPGTGLAFYGPTTSVDMITGINALAGAGTRLVVDDLIFFDEPKFQDGLIAQAARTLAVQSMFPVSRPRTGGAWAPPVPASSRGAGSLARAGDRLQLHEEVGAAVFGPARVR